MTRFLKPWLLEPWRTRVLWASLGLNLFAVGLFAAPHMWDRRLPGPPSFDTLVERMSRDLPAADATLFRAAMARERPWFDQGRERMQEARGAVATRVTAEPFDPAAMRTSLQAMQDRMRESSARFDESLVTAVGQLSPDARLKLAETLRQRRP